MKLNIGCGYNHLKDYINIDSSKDSLADKIMSAHCLDIKSNVADEIKVLHLIEHLGFFRTKYFLSEAFRTLKVGGILIIETPHIEKSFENFLNGNKSERESVLGWIYGSESAGMNHIYCFPIELMDKILAEAGFEVIKRKYLNYYPNRPAVRFTMKKKAGLRHKSLMVEFRYKLVKKNIVVFKDEYVMSENENILEAIEKYFIKADYDLILKLSINNSTLVHEFFRFVAREDKSLNRYSRIADNLRGLNFDCLMYEYLMKEDLKKESQKTSFENVIVFANKVIEGLLRGEKIKLKAAKEKKFEVFSFNMAKAYSQKYFKKGLKELNMDNFKKAEKYFTKSIKLNRDDLDCWKDLLKLKKQRSNI